MDLYYNTRSMCPECNELVPGKVISKNGQVFIERTCPAHGMFEGLVCSDIGWYERLPQFYVEGIKPKNPTTSQEKGCPEDCGLCPAHSQIAGTVAIEISNKCNGACPACLANNTGTFELGVNDVLDAVNAVLKNQSAIDTVTLSGGEPTIHPKFFEIVKALDRPEIGRIAVNSNGIRIASDEEFVKRLADEKKVYVSLHFDGAHANKLRGTDFAMQERAADTLDRYGVDMVPVILAARDINDRELGSLVEQLLTKYPTVKAIIISLMTYAGKGGSAFPHNPLTRLTIPEALDNIQHGTKGVIDRNDFMPLPMPNPMCAAIGYFMVMDNEITPLLPYGEVKDVLEFMKNGHFAKFSNEFGQYMRDAVNMIYANSERFADSRNLLGKIRKILELLFPLDKPVSDDERAKLSEKHFRAVYLMQFMDSWTFDSRRLSKCSCQHVLPGGKIVSSCGYYSYHRRFDPRYI
jgi:uncharacterized radical SAM superfamily Fe-S cluster-containing enzyme